MKRPAKCERHWAATVDHVIPLAKNGSDSWDNKLVAHAKCNVAKDDKYPKPCEMFYLETINLILASGKWTWRQNSKGQYEYQPIKSLARKYRAASAARHGQSIAP